VQEFFLKRINTKKVFGIIIDFIKIKYYNQGNDFVEGEII